MDKSEIKKHFDDYEGAIEALKVFVNAIVWKSNDIEEGASEEEIAAHIKEFIHEQGGDLLSSLHQQIMEYMWTFYYELDDADNVIYE